MGMIRLLGCIVSPVVYMVHIVNRTVEFCQRHTRGNAPANQVGINVVDVTVIVGIQNNPRINK